MFKRLITAITGDPNEKVLKPFRQQVTRINELEKDFEKKSNDELRNMTAQFQQRIRSATEPILEELEGAQQQYVDVLGTDDQKFARVEVERIRKDLLAAETEILDEILPEAFAAVREASKRTTGLRHYDVQMLGGMVLNSGRIAEMKTGEGKTLVATLPLYLNALAGRGAHLSRRRDLGRPPGPAQPRRHQPRPRRHRRDRARPRARPARPRARPGCRSAPAGDRRHRRALRGRGPRRLRLLARRRRRQLRRPRPARAGQRERLPDRQARKRRGRLLDRDG